MRDLQAGGGGLRQHVLAVRFHTAPCDEEWPASLALQLSDRVHCQQPPLVRIPASHLGQDQAAPKAVLRHSHESGSGWLERLGRDPIGNHQGVHVVPPHLVAHEAADRRDGRGGAKSLPRHVLESERVVGVPEQGDPIPMPGLTQQAIELDHRVGRVPLFREDDRTTPRVRPGSRCSRRRKGGSEAVKSDRLRPSPSYTPPS